MQKDKKKPKWQTPKLIVLVRGDGQERVLQNCKTGAGFDYTLTNNINYGCIVVVVECTNCDTLGS